MFYSVMLSALNVYTEIFTQNKQLTHVYKMAKIYNNISIYSYVYIMYIHKKSNNIFNELNVENMPVFLLVKIIFYLKTLYVSTRNL